MPPPPRIFAGDVELGKRDDDHRPGTTSSFRMAWQHRQVPNGLPRRTVKRIAIALLALVALYYFFRNMPTDLHNPRPRPNYDHSGPPRPPKPPMGPPKPSPPASKGDAPSNEREKHTEQSQHYFNGPIKFYELATSLTTTGRYRGIASSKNVLFAAASLKSASTLLPIACEMSLQETNDVHFALMGRDNISMDALKTVNGITKECKIVYHDARPDFSLESSDFRMEVSCSAAFKHINTYISPQATFVDVSGQEDLFLLTGLKDRAMALERTIIPIPENAEQNLMWTTLLDSASLSAWNKVNMEILVHAPPSASGSLIRLLESLKNADFFLSAPPKLTIELPHEIDEPTSHYLQTFRWPPNSDINAGNMLTLHHRIPQHGLTVEENSIRFLESFWPADANSSHVLVLSPQVELSPLFFHYLKYTVLDYKYSARNIDSHQSLLGISLDLPSMHINNSAEFRPPVSAGPKEADLTQFLWQAPNSNAALYFGDKWVELHDFVSHMLISEHALPTPTTLNQKLVSKAYPSWLEHILKLARARGYWTLYPNFKDTEALATVHTELYQLPEEYSHDPQVETPGQGTDLTADPANHKHTEAPLISKSLLNVLPNNGALPKIRDLPLLTWDGETIKVADIEKIAAKYSSIFRHEIGGCDATVVEKQRSGLTASDLFCLEDKKA